MNYLLEALIKKLEGEVAIAKANIKVYETNPAGIGEHPDVVQAVETQIEVIAGAEEKIETVATRKRTDLEGIDAKISDILDEYIRPAVESDGGAIDFHSFEDGKVNVVLRGACSGCPSSTMTLKAGIENMLKEMLPNQISEVIAING